MASITVAITVGLRRPFIDVEADGGDDNFMFCGVYVRIINVLMCARVRA